MHRVNIKGRVSILWGEKATLKSVCLRLIIFIDPTCVVSCPKKTNTEKNSSCFCAIVTASACEFPSMPAETAAGR